MHRIDTSTALKDKFGAGKNGFTRGNPQTGTPATDLDDDYFDMLQEELAGIIEAAGMALDKSKHDQLRDALPLFLGLKDAAKRTVGTATDQIPDMAFFSASLSASGRQKLPSGLIIQWGQVLSNSGGFAPWTFPIAFPNQCFQVLASTFVGASAQDFTVTMIGNPSLTAITAACYVSGVQSSINGQVGVRYLAIGN
ncbi:gp53-like domain-containing protein [Atlantibacter sp.]|uniref:gp53-like domain-containing protein n=1 Tax=Atlantibacter sp. TaxID=1903473 RepID=UPI0028AF3015|nr:hypothetical protein [Atlantibacter sp.]